MAPATATVCPPAAERTQRVAAAQASPPASRRTAWETAIAAHRACDDAEAEAHALASWSEQTMRDNQRTRRWRSKPRGSAGGACRPRSPSSGRGPASGHPAGQTRRSFGAGARCDGQVLVTHDVLGLFDRFTPKFVKKYADFHGAMQKVFADYIEDVETKRFPAQEHTVEMDTKQWDALLKEIG